MPLGLKFKSKPFADDEIVNCIETYFVDGREDPVRRGQTFRGGEPVVRAHPHFFAHADATSAEIHAQRKAVIFDHSDEQSLAAEAAYRADQAKRYPTPDIPVDRRVVATSAFMAGGRRFSEGHTYDVDDAIVKANKGFFAWPPKPLT